MIQLHWQHSIFWYKSIFEYFIYFTNFSRIRLFIEIFYEYFTISNLFAHFTFNQNNYFYFCDQIRFRIYFFSTFDFLFFSFAFCDYVEKNHSMTQNLKTLYNIHLIENIKTLKCNWFIQTKKTQKNYHLRKHKLKIKNKLKEKMKQLTKQKKKIRLIKKRTEKYTCKRCKTIKFDNNIKLHEHIRIRHAKKSKFVSSQSIVSSFTFFQSINFSFFVSLFRSIDFSFFSLSKLIVASSIIFIFLKFSFEISLDFSSIVTSRKSIF